ncbi:MAG: class I SAM-dependent methyltransferase [Bacteroidota bacterium]
MNSEKSERNLVQFYDSLANEYDELTGFAERFDKEHSAFQMLVQKYDLKIVLDAGCGTGFHSILLAQLGLHVTAADISEQMLRQAKQNAEHMSVQVETIQTSFQGMNESVHNKFDAVFCLGNTLPHVLTEEELFQSFKSFRKILNSDGRVFLQLLNYDRILNFRERILNVKEVNDKIFVRFYDYEGETILFNILTIEKKRDKLKHSLNSVRLTPWRSSDIVRTLKDGGFHNAELFGTMSLNTYDEYSSKDLVVIAQL